MIKTAHKVETTPYMKLLSIKIKANTLPSILFGQYLEQYEKILRFRITLAMLLIMPYYIDSKIKSSSEGRKRFDAFDNFVFGVLTRNL